MDGAQPGMEFLVAKGCVRGKLEDNNFNPE